MAGIQGILPPKFSASASADKAQLIIAWKDYKADFNMYLLASGQGTLDDKQKIAMLLYQMGKHFIKVHNTDFVFDPPENKDKYDSVVAKFDEHFEPKKLVKGYITKFQRRMQGATETITDYITALRELAKLCGFGNEEDMIAVQISNGVRDEHLKRKLWEEDMTLKDVIAKCQSFELRNEHSKLYSGMPRESVEVNFQHSNSYGSRGRSRGRQQGPGRSRGRGRGFDRSYSSRGRGHSQAPSGGRGYGQGPARGQCSKCATSHPPRRCKAYNKQCNYCSAFGHFERCCLKKKEQKVNFVEDDEYGYEPANLYEICSVNINGSCVEDPWTVVLRTPYKNGKVGVKMKIDTQAHCNTLSKESFDKLCNHANLKLLSSESTITAFGNGIVKPIGKAQIQVVLKKRTFVVQCEVVDGNVPNLLSARDSERLGLVRRVYSAKTGKVPNPGVREQPLFDDEFLRRVPNLKNVPQCILDIVREFQDRFPVDRVGKIPGEVHLSIDPEYKDGPVSYGSRPVPAAMRELTKAQLDFLEKQEIITKVPKGVPTPWCSQMHVVHKKDGKSVRVCIDPKFLNKALLREYHPIKTLEDVLTKVQGSKYFTVLDANMGFYQLQLDAESQLLTCFQSPWGRYMYRRLPMGIKSCPEQYQRAIEEIFEGVDNLENIFDDVLLHTLDVEGQCKVLRRTLEKAREHDLTFRLSKCMFAQPEVDYTGHVLTDDGVKVSPEKVAAILEMPEPQSKEDVRTLLGMATYLSKYIPNFSDLTEDLREVVKKKTDDQGRNEPFYFDEPQRVAFQKLKVALTQAPVMSYYSLDEPIVVSCDASLGGLGAVLLQKDHPIAYASKSLTNTERAYAQIEKELLAIVFACRKFHHLLYGRSDITIETDHLPLVNIIEKPLGQVPMRLQKMLLKLQPYSFKLIGKSGKDIPVADCLSRAPLKNCHYRGLVDDMRDYQVCATEMFSTQVFPDSKFEQIKSATQNDVILQKLSSRVVHGWPRERNQIESDLKPYWDFREEITVYDGVLFRGERVIIPREMQRYALDLVHSSHQGVVKTKQFARDLVFWKGMNNQIEDVVGKCGLCQKHRAEQQKEPMMSTEVPTLPWQSVSSDLFDYEDQWYLATVDHFSGYLEVDELNPNHSAPVVISKLKRIFATHGIPKILYSDPGSEFTSGDFADFSKQWGFDVQPYSAKYPQANGMAEKAVQIAKNLLRKSQKDGTDLQLALLQYRNTPRDSTLGSPVQRCMNRRTRTRVPTSDALLKPELIDTSRVTTRLKECRAKNKSHYDKHARPLPNLNPGDTVRYRTGKTWTPAKFISPAEKPRSYQVQTPSGRVIVRNRRHLLKTKESSDIYEHERRQLVTRQELANDAMSRPLRQNIPRPAPVVARPSVVANPNPPVPSRPPDPVTCDTQLAKSQPVPAAKAPVEMRVSGRISRAPSNLDDFVK